jgi:hypothetical protein
MVSFLMLILGIVHIEFKLKKVRTGTVPPPGNFICNRMQCKLFLTSEICCFPGD